jgi:hypothetical protein
MGMRLDPRQEGDLGGKPMDDAEEAQYGAGVDDDGSSKEYVVIERRL